MSIKVEVQPQSDRELVLCRILDAPAEKLFQAWTNPELMKQWFVPKPWTMSAEKMGFHTGWGTCADQLEALVRSL